MRQILGFFAAVILVAGLSSFATMRWAGSRHTSHHGDAHDWLHSELKITPEQHKALEPIEEKFAVRNRLLRERMRAANHELAVAIKKGRPEAPEIGEAIGKIHLAMGELQQASIEHIFEMRRVLTPEQGERLLDLAQKTLDSAPP